MIKYPSPSMAISVMLPVDSALLGECMVSMDAIVMPKPTCIGFVPLDFPEVMPLHAWFGLKYPERQPGFF